jgi:hypothetical protein
VTWQQIRVTPEGEIESEEETVDEQWVTEFHNSPYGWISVVINGDYIKANVEYDSLYIYLKLDR